MTDRRPSNFRGFTLLELILVMTIITIMAAIIVPSLSGFSRGRRLSNAGSQFLSVAGMARAQAIRRGVPYRLNIDLNNRRYWITYQQDDGATFVEDDQRNLNYTLPDDIQMATTGIPTQSDGLYLQFEPSGRVSTGTVRFVIAATNEEVDIGSLSATENFHVLNDTERQGVAI